MIPRNELSAEQLERELDKGRDYAEANQDQPGMGYVRTTTKKEREKARLAEAAMALAKDGAFDKSEAMFPMVGDCPPEVFADKQFRAIFHLWKRAGGKKDDPRVQRMRERWVAIVGGST